MKIDDVIGIFERVGNDVPMEVCSYLDPASGKTTTTAR
jgi:hypothetical protein